jgi:hypothetical protein
MAIVHTAIVSNVRPPIARVKSIVSIIESPVTRCPKKTIMRRPHPNARHPIIAIVTISPVAWCPKIIINRAWRLCIKGQWRRSNTYCKLD